MVHSTNDVKYKLDVLDSDLPVLVDFWAKSCAPCRYIVPILEKISEKATGNARVFKLNVDENPNSANIYGISAIPTVILFKNGKVYKNFVGVQSAETYEEALEL